MVKSRGIRPDAVAIYIRWSTEEQGEGTTLEVQRERCSLFVQSQGWMVRADLLFVDEGCSGASLDRPAMKRLREAVSQNRVDCVVTYKLDRLSRNLADTVSLIRQEWAGKCLYRSATEGFDTAEDSPTGGLIFNVLASFAEFERAVIRDRTRAGSLRRMREGMYISGTVPFGYERAGKGRLAVRHGEAETVRRIYRMAAENVVATASGIARQLNEEGLPGPSGDRWWASAVERILRNPIYTGTVVYGRRHLPPTVLGGHGRFDANGQPLAQVDGAVPPIVDRETFAQVHALLLQRKESRPKHSNRASADYLLSTIARCKCGGPLGGVKDRYGNVYYRCQRKQQGLGCAAGSVAFRGGPVEARVVAALRERYGGSRKAEALGIIQERLRSASRRVELDQALREVSRRKAQVLADVARLRRKARQGALKPSTYEELKADADAELHDLEMRQRGLHTQQAAAGDDGATLALDGMDEWDALTALEQKGLLRVLCQQITVLYRGRHRGGIAVEVTWVG